MAGWGSYVVHCNALNGEGESEGVAETGRAEEGVKEEKQSLEQRVAATTSQDARK